MKQEDNEKSTVKNIERYFRMVIIAFFAGILGWKLITASWTFNMSNFDFNALLSLLLALFSVALAVFFFFKATDTSNLFYDNTYKFTKDISEILGRIEAGFGERLKHLDEGYSGLRDKFNNGYSNVPVVQKIEKTSKEIEEEKKKLEQQMKEKEEILEKLMVRAKVQEKEKNEILKDINSKDEQILNLNREIKYLKRRLDKEETLSERETIHRFPIDIIEMLKVIIMEKLGKELAMEASFELVSKKFETGVTEILTEKGINDLRKFGIVIDGNHLTEKGFDLIQNIAKRLI